MMGTQRNKASAITGVLLACAVYVFGQGLPFPGPGTVHTVAAAYSGPGDVITANGVAWWGLRAYSAATVSTVSANVCNASDTNCADVSTLSTGLFDVATATGAPLNCGGAGGTCTIKTLYDKSGALACSGTTACNLTQATISARPVLTFNCLGTTLPCMTLATTRKIVSAALASTQAQPFSASFVAKRTGNFTDYMTILGNQASGGDQVGFFGGANSIMQYGGGSIVQTTGAADSAFHAVQFLFSGASSTTVVDGSSSAAAASGVQSLSSTFCIGACQFDPLAAVVTEGGWWSGDKTSNFSALNSNQHAFWGF